MKKVCLLLSFTILLVFLSGCWDYREIEDVAIANIIAIDKDKKTNQYILSINIMDATGLSQGGDISPLKVEAKGRTLVDAVRNLISITTMTPYWSHVTMIVIGEDMAREGIVPILDWIARSPEFQLNLAIFVSKEKTAREILEKSQKLTILRIFEYEIVRKSFRFSSKLPAIKASKIINEVQSKVLYTVLPTVEIVDINGETYTNFLGSAYFSKGKMEGFFDPIETMKYLFVLDQVKGGVMVIPTKGVDEKVTLDIYRNSTTVDIGFIDDTIQITVNIKPTVNIPQIDGRVDYTSKEGRKILKEKADAYLEKEIKSFIEGVQEDPGIDVFNFGNKIKKRHPGIWDDIEDDWGQIFKEVSIEVNSDIKIKSSQQIKAPIGADIE